MGREEQKEEREVLDSIFPDEITGMNITCHRGCITNTCPDVSDFEYRISVALEPPEGEEDTGVESGEEAQLLDSTSWT